MSPIIDVQRRLHESGRIRIGAVVAGETAGGKKYKRPAKLETFRLTSSNEAALRAVAGLYGGKVVPWADAPTHGQFELLTEATSIKVLVPPERMSFTQNYELWSGGGCKRRCNGAFQIPSEEDCVCDPDNRECKPHTRLSVMLADLPGAGLWRLDTQGFNAMNELGGAFQLAQLIAQASGRSILPGVLRLDQRETKRPDPEDESKTITRKFVVPVLDFDVDMTALAYGAQGAIAAPVPGLTPVAPALEEPVSLADEIRGIETPTERPRRANSAEPVKSTGVPVRARGSVHEDEERSAGEPMATGDQLAHILSGIGMASETEKAAIQRWWYDEKGYPHLPRDLTFAQAAEVLAHIMDVLDEDEEPAPVVVPDVVRPDEVLPPRPTEAKMKQMFALLGELGVRDNDEQHARVWAIVGHEGSFKELSRAEVNKVIDQLTEDREAQRAGAVSVTSAPDGADWDPEPFES